MEPSEVACAEMFCGETMAFLKMTGATLRQSEDLFIKIGGGRIAGFVTNGLVSSFCDPVWLLEIDDDDEIVLEEELDLVLIVEILSSDVSIDMDSFDEES